MQKSLIQQYIVEMGDNFTPCFCKCRWILRNSEMGIWMSNEGRKNKPVSFNTTDEHDLALLKHAEQINPLTNKPRNM